ncbi:MAG TPA: glycosyltransferase family 2 protein [Bacilli bacterium]|nr:glycosyltransferase family 2 protein [Bacilli bacterium]
MANPIAVSVIIPVRNSEKYLSSCLFSVVSQDFSLPYEVLIINNGSTDNSREIIEKYAKKYKFVRQIITDGLSVGFARKRGIDEARGQYICFLDSDDMYKLSFLKNMYETITQNEADIINCSYVKIKANGRISRNILARKQVLNRIQGVRTLLRDFNIRGYMPMKMYRADLIKNTKLPVSSRLIMFEDFLINFALYCKANKSVTITEPLYFYRRTNESATTNLSSNRTDLHLKCFAAVRYLAEQTGDKLIIEEFFKRGFRYWLSIFADVLLSIKVNERSFFIELHRAEKIKRIILSRKAFPIQGMPWEHLISEIR